jgi:hypothetical protein
MHQAVVYEMKTAAAPEKHIANNKKDRPSGGLRAGQTVNHAPSPWITYRSCSQVQLQVLDTPIFDHDRGNDQDGNAQQVVVEHGIPIFETGHLDPLPHGQDVSGREQAVASHPQVPDVDVSQEGPSGTDKGKLESGSGVDGGTPVLGDHGIGNISPGGDDG